MFAHLNFWRAFTDQEDYYDESETVFRNQEYGKIVEYIIVIYPTERIVFVNGLKSGMTNQSLRIESGTHEISLGPLKNYEPSSQVVLVSSTTVLDPFAVEFSPTESEDAADHND